jgi:glycerophosphoryl diester phosphodiesterase
MVKSYFFTGTPLKTDSNNSNTEYTGLDNPIPEVSSNGTKAIMLQKRRSPMIIAHRGASAFAPENTIAAFRLAAESGCEGIEMDLRLSKDAEAVVIHDKSLRRTGGLDRLVSELSVNELKKIDVGSWFFRKYPKRFRREYSKERVPTLKEVFHELSFYQGIFYLELKGKQSDIPKLAEAVDRAIPEDIRNRVIIKTFKVEQLPTIKSICSGTRLAALFAPKILNVVRKEKRLIRLASQYGADEISLH